MLPRRMERAVCHIDRDRIDPSAPMPRSVQNAKPTSREKSSAPPPFISLLSSFNLCLLPLSYSPSRRKSEPVPQADSPQDSDLEATAEEARLPRAKPRPRTAATTATSWHHS